MLEESIKKNRILFHLSNKVYIMPLHILLQNMRLHTISTVNTILHFKGALTFCTLKSRPKRRKWIKIKPTSRMATPKC